MSSRPESGRSAAGPQRISQKVARRGATPRPGQYDPQVGSEGMTIDTPLGPVDLVAVHQALAGIPTPVTLADLRYAYAIVRPDRLSTALAARGLGVSAGTVARGCERAKVRARPGGVERLATQGI